MNRLILIAIALTAIMAPTFAHQPGAMEEVRFCGEPQRDAEGRIVRSRAVLRAFQRLYACPSTGKTTGPCPGWAINHTIPLACGGCDSVANLDWMPDRIKSCAEPWCRDRWEREVYDRPGTNTPSCTNEIQRWSAPADEASMAPSRPFQP